MTLPKTLIAIAALTCATSFAPGQAADNLSGKLVKAYNAHNYQSAEAYGEKLLAKSPRDYNAHYYLANIYVILHKNEQAIAQYRICVNSGVPGPLREYSTTALERLLKQKEQMLMAASQADKQKDNEIKEFKRKLHAETRMEQDRLRSEWNAALARLDQNNGFRRGGFGRGGGGGFGRGGFEERFRINDTYSKRMAELSEHEENMLSQANCGTGKIRLAPNLSSSKVKNYINYGDESEAAEIPVDNPLHATARALGDPLPRPPLPKFDNKKSSTVKSSKSVLSKDKKSGHTISDKTVIPNNNSTH